MTHALIVDQRLLPQVHTWGALTVHSVFARAANLVAGDQLITFGDPSVEPGPRTAVLSSLPTNLVVGGSFSADSIEWAGATSWQPPTFPAAIRPAALRFAREELTGKRPPLNAFEEAALARIEGTGILERPGSATDLVGLGTGLTPTGDDYLAGFALGCVASGWDVVDLGEAIGLGTTNQISQVMLTEALKGRATQPLHTLLDTLSTNEELSARSISRALTGVLKIGHTSGYALASGLLAALESITAQKAQKEGIDVDHDSRQAEYVH